MHRTYILKLEETRFWKSCSWIILLDKERTFRLVEWLAQSHRAEDNNNSTLCCIKFYSFQILSSIAFLLWKLRFSDFNWLVQVIYPLYLSFPLLHVQLVCLVNLNTHGREIFKKPLKEIQVQWSSLYFSWTCSEIQKIKPSRFLFSVYTSNGFTW